MEPCFAEFTPKTFHWEKNETFQVKWGLIFCFFWGLQVIIFIKMQQCFLKSAYSQNCTLLGLISRPFLYHSPGLVQIWTKSRILDLIASTVFTFFHHYFHPISLHSIVNLWGSVTELIAAQLQFNPCFPKGGRTARQLASRDKSKEDLKAAVDIGQHSSAM